MGTTSGRSETPTTNYRHRGRATDNEGGSENDICVVSSRSSVSTRKDPVSELTKQEMRLMAEEEDEARLRAKGEADKAKGKAIMQEQSHKHESAGGEQTIQD